MSTHLPIANSSQPVAAILAGGRGSRMGGAEKGLLKMKGMPMIDRVLAALRPQTSRQIIVANRHHEDYAARGLPVIADHWPGHEGPLAGIHAALSHVVQGEVLIVPVDAPQLPPDLLVRLQAARQRAGSDAACVRDASGLQPLCCLLPAAWAEAALTALQAGERSVQRWLMARHVAMADYTASPALVWSLNTPSEWARCEQTL